jgi:immune inhibitor A
VHRRILVGLSTAALVAAGLTTAGTAAQAAPPQGDTVKTVAAPVDDLPNPAEEKRRALRQEALADVLTGDKTTERRGDSTVVKMGTKPGPKSKKKSKAGKVDQYVELSREKTDKIFVVLAEFGNERHPNYPDQDTDPNTVGPVKFDGPLHNATTPPSGRRTTTSSTSRTCTSRPIPGSTRSRTTTTSSRPAGTPSRATSPTG